MNWADYVITLNKTFGNFWCMIMGANIIESIKFSINSENCNFAIVIKHIFPAFIILNLRRFTYFDKIFHLKIKKLLTGFKDKKLLNNLKLILNS
jgi:hypothetical protein